MSFQNLHVIINPASGQNKPILNTLSDVFQEHDVSWQVSITTKERDGTQLARQAAESGVDLVVVYGGDGTARQAAVGLMDTDIPMAFLPGGTGNALATEFNIPTDLTQAAQHIFKSKPHPVDLGYDGERYFVLRVDIGVSAQLIEESSRDLKDQWGELAYIASGIQAGTDATKQRYQLEIDGENFEQEGVACMVANCTAVGAMNLKLGDHVTPVDGLLDVFVLRSVPKVASAVTEQLLISGDDGPNGAFHRQAKDVRVSTGAEAQVSYDGDIIGTTPRHITIIPEAFQLLIP